MKENYELMEHIYKDAEMASYTLTKLIRDLKDKDNKIKKTLEDIMKEYEPEFDQMLFYFCIFGKKHLCLFIF